MGLDFGVSIGGFNPTDPFGDRAHDRAKTAAKDAFNRSIRARRTEYQDKVYSLEKAGLNRMLAVGGQPTGVQAQQAATHPTKGEVKISQLEGAQIALAQSTAKKENSLRKQADEMLKSIEEDARAKKRENDYWRDHPQQFDIQKKMDMLGAVIPALGGGAAALLGKYLMKRSTPEAKAERAKKRFEKAKKKDRKIELRGGRPWLP